MICARKPHSLHGSASAPIRRSGCANNFRLCHGVTSGSAMGASRPWGQIQLTIMKFCIRIRYPASSRAVPRAHFGMSASSNWHYRSVVAGA